LITRQNLLWRWFAIYQCGLYILTTRYIHQPSSKSLDTSSIISDIHRLRFNPKKLLLISGDHFNALFVRNLGVFYYPLLDDSITSSDEDWKNRQAVYLQTVAYSLGVFEKHSDLTTTIVAMGRYMATCVNFYSYPSDALYGMLYALSALVGRETARPFDYQVSQHKLTTQPATQELISHHKDTLARLYDRYKQTVFDDTTCLVRTDVHLSGAKDITKRQSAFYDNVIYWKTTALAMDLGIIPRDEQCLQRIKSTTLKTFWLKNEGYFLEDLSEDGKKEKFYSSDWLIVLSTGFLNPKTDLEYFTRSIEYIRAHKIDRPFAIKYQQTTRAHRQFLAVRLTVASYGGDSIWSFWGMEYIKTLVAVYKATGAIEYLDDAKYHLKRYEAAMLREKGFPEVYDKRGRILQTTFYRSILQTGWVIGYEQAKAIFDSAYRDVSAR
jgi:hypothetical protein